MYPEMMKKEDICFPHELAPKLVNEPHFLRVWQHYREHIFKLRLAELVDAEGISKEDADAFRRFCGGQDTPAFHMFILAKQGRMEHLRDDADYQATLRVMTALGWEAIEIEKQKHWSEYWAKLMDPARPWTMKHVMEVAPEVTEQMMQAITRPSAW